MQKILKLQLLYQILLFIKLNFLILFVKGFGLIRILSDFTFCIIKNVDPLKEQ